MSLREACSTEYLLKGVIDVFMTRFQTIEIVAKGDLPDYVQGLQHTKKTHTYLYSETYL